MESRNKKYTSEDVISDEAFDLINSELLKGNQWIAYNTTSYFLDKNDVCFFNNKDEANDFAESNISEYDNYRVIKAISVDDVLKQIPYGEERLLNQTNSITQKTNFMNQKNFEYLKDQVKFTGFGDALENDLKEKLQQRSREFQLCHDTKFGNDIVVATLNFKRSEQSDMYFFNSYNLTLKKDESRDLMKQDFYINKGNNITLKEAYNLRDGRSVNKDLTNKEGQVYNAWLQMDFKETDKNGNYQLKHFHQNYGFNLEKELVKHPIKELTNEQDKTRLMESLQKGNRQSVTFVKEGTEQKVFIEANPRFKAVNVYDNNMQRLGSRQTKAEKQEQGENNSAKQEIKKENRNQSDDDDNPEAPKAAKKRTKKQSPSV